MNECCFVSSVNLPYHNLCGKEFLDSFLHHVDPRINLQLWCDATIENKELLDYALPLGCNGRIQRFDLGLIPNVTSFLTDIEPRKLTPVSPDPLERLCLGSGYQYKKDARTFGLKGLAFSASLSYPEPRYIFWVDADTVFRRPIGKDFLIQLFRGSSVVYFGRDYPHSETGFVGIDRAGEGVEEFRLEYMKCWVEGTVFNLNGWTDSHVFDHALQLARRKGLKVRSLSSRPSGHVISTSLLGPFLEHKKGTRKLPRTVVGRVKG